MIITVRVNTHAKRNAVEHVGDNRYKISVTVVPEHGKANEAIIKLLADFFDVSKSGIRILSGANSRNKTVSVLS